MPSFPQPLPLDTALGGGLVLSLSRAVPDLDRYEHLAHLSPDEVDAVSVELRDGGDAVGRGTFHAYADGAGSFEEIWVAPARRREGLASMVYDAVEGMGIEVVPSMGRSWMGEALWASRDARRASARFAA